jgi:hypothetical protein
MKHEKYHLEVVCVCTKCDTRLHRLSTTVAFTDLSEFTELPELREKAVAIIKSRGWSFKEDDNVFAPGHVPKNWDK